jgi:hypothetical protein
LMTAITIFMGLAPFLNAARRESASGARST